LWHKRRGLNFATAINKGETTGTPGLPHQVFKKIVNRLDNPFPKIFGALKTMRT
jgi:hypothetical protein